MYQILHDLNIKVDKSTIFNAISTPDGLNNWWTLKCDGKPGIDEIFNLYFTNEYNWYAKITKFEFDEVIEFTMISSSFDWLPTKFGFILTQIDTNTTSVSFYHSNWKEENKEFRITSYCWANLLRQLKNYLEQGIITPFNERN
jgi:uncharacterized protein YndB with AHSA1/START domain